MNKKKRHHAIFVSGLNGGQKGNYLIPYLWNRFGIVTHIHKINWHDGEHFKPKLDKLISTIDELAGMRYQVSLTGSSAGANTIFNTFCKRRNQINKIVNIGGRLRVGDYTNQYALKRKSETSAAFRESVIWREGLLALLATDKNRILTIRPVYDELVLAKTVIVAGAKNLVFPFIEHSITNRLTTKNFAPLITIL